MELDKVKEIEKLFKPSVEVVVDEIKLRLDGKKSFEDKFFYEFLPEVEEY